jgi:predicted PurR-regulated permease PerM
VLISSQASHLGEAWPTLSAKFKLMFEQTVGWISHIFNIPIRKINVWTTETRADLLEKSGTVIGLTLTKMGDILATLFLTPVYIFMILYYQTHLTEFIHRLCGGDQAEKVSEILTETKTIIQSYLVGLFAEFAIIAALNSMGLLVLGIEYALLLGLLAALLNIVPYLGGIVAMGLIMLVALVTKSPIFMFYVLILYTIIQLIDNNYIVPKIIGSKVKLNALVSLLAVILGGAIWGIPGMFLSIPLTAILKLIFDRIDSLKPIGFLLGDPKPAFSKLRFNLKLFKK